MSYISRLSLCLILFVAAVSSSYYRLPTTVQPVEYTITTHPFFDDHTFIAFEYIDILINKEHLVKSSKLHLQIKINTRDITINHGHLRVHHTKNGELKHMKYDMNSYDSDRDTQTSTLNFHLRISDALDFLNGNDALSATLYLNYKGFMQVEAMNGLYITSYKHNGRVIHNAITHFEATNARRLFPCFDEPRFKAKFNINVYAPRPAVVLSNTFMKYEEVSHKHDCIWTSHKGYTTGCKLVSFGQTQKMSTYLVAFVIGDYEYVSGKSGHISQRIYFPIQKHIRAKFALESTLSIMPYYEKIFDMKYKLHKMYSLAVSDFKMGAMENWGMVTYRDIRLLVNPAHSTLMDVMQVAMVIAHEEAHQWFGNVVTMKWWNHIWLNEGFAAYFQIIGAQHAYPKMNYWNLFYYDTHRALLMDASHETHAIVVTKDSKHGEMAVKPKAVRSLFDGITYHKGAGVLHMLSEYMGHKTFMHGLQAYLAKYQFSNTETKDLFEILAYFAVKDNSGWNTKDITLFMNDWVMNVGLPVLNVDLYTKDGKMVLKVDQTRMIPNLPSQTSLDMSQLWSVPLQIRDCGGLGVKQLHRGRVVYLDIIQRKCGNQYYIINPEMKAIFRTNYGPESLDLIVAAFGKLTKVDQFSVVADRFSLLKYNHITVGNYIAFVSSVVSKLDGSVNYLLWRLIIESFVHIDDLYCEFFNSKNMKNQLLRKNYRFFGRLIIHKVWKSIGKWDGYGSDHYKKRNNDGDKEPNDHILLRPLILSALVRLEDNHIINEGYNLLMGIMDKNNARFSVTKEGYFDADIDANILKSIFEAGLSKMNGNYASNNAELIFDKLVDIYGKANTEIETDILGSIGAVYRDPRLLKKAIAFVRSDKVRRNVKGHGFGSLRRCYGRGVVWENVLKRSGGRPSWAGMAATFANMRIYRRIKDYYFDNDGRRRLIHSKVHVVRAILERILLNTKLLNTDTDKTYKWLNDYVYRHSGGKNKADEDEEFEESKIDVELEINDMRDEKLSEMQSVYDSKIEDHYFDKYFFGKFYKENKKGEKYANGPMTDAWLSFFVLLVLSFVIIVCFLISLRLYSLPKNRISIHV